MQRYVLPSLLLLAAIARAADPLPSMEDLQKALDAKDYPALLSGSSRVLALRGPATESYHRTAVWMFKAEALVQSSQFTPAAQAFAGAAAEKDATDDERDLALASAMVMKHSDRKGYQSAATREHPTPQQYDVLDPANRKDAMAAMLEAELDDLTPRIEKTKDTLAPNILISAAKKLADLRPLERAGEKSSDKIDALEKTLGQNFTTQAGDWADKCGKRLDTLATTSQQVVITRYVDSKGVPRTRTGIRGLTQPEQTEVRQLAKDAKNYAAVEQQVSAAMSEVGKAAITPAQKPIQSVFDQTQTVLHAAVLGQ